MVLVGPGGSGKTTLVETLLASAGAIPRAGTVRDGTTVCDFDEAESKHGRSVSLAIAPVVHRETKVNLVDTPGTPTSWATSARGCGPPTARCS